MGCSGKDIELKRDRKQIPLPKVKCGLFLSFCSLTSSTTQSINLTLHHALRRPPRRPLLTNIKKLSHSHRYYWLHQMYT
ncbi:hypothetical protein ACN42_g3163 [Penicillium freii]|uniref:Uncharacterized protein n=1 Tax=Penicillium freii TaxID=48697 RepID=A0A101MNT6_PENFR|nr:hypothetical protein ACN42_g3163 [Penicillium freii]